MVSIQARFDRSFVDQYRGARGAVQRESGGFRSEELQRSIEEKRSRGRGKGRREQIDPTAPVVVTQPVETSPTPTPTQPVTTTPPNTQSPQPVSSPTATDATVRSLAEKYVDVYAQQSGRSLSSATRDALVADVASFYGENGTRTDRLRSLVGVF